MNNNYNKKINIINYEKCSNNPIIFNQRFKEPLIYSNTYTLYIKDLEYSIIMKVYSNKFYFKLLRINKNDNNKKNISFYENNYDVNNIKNYLSNENENEIKTFEEIINIINKELSNKNIEIIDDIESKIKLNFKNLNNNIIFELTKIELYKKIKDHLNFIDNNTILNTNINPYFTSNNIIIKNALSLFEIYYPFDYEDDIFIIYQNKNLNIMINSIIKNKLIASLNISEKITFIKHFFNPKNSYDYLCISGINKIIYVYNLSLNYSLLYQIKIFYSFNIFSCLLFFDNKNNNNYLITSTYSQNKDDYTKVYILEEGQFIKNYPGTNENLTTLLIYWFHKKLKSYYIIELCTEKIFIYGMITNGLYLKLNYKDVDFLNGCIIEDKDKNEYLFCSTYDNNIYVFDLYKKKLERIIKFWNNIKQKNNIYDIIKWSNEYLIINNYSNKCMSVIDVEQNKIVNSIKEIDNVHFLFIKKIIHPIYGECLLTSSDDLTIKIWI